MPGDLLRGLLKSNMFFSWVHYQGSNQETISYDAEDDKKGSNNCSGLFAGSCS